MLEKNKQFTPLSMIHFIFNRISFFEFQITSYIRKDMCTEAYWIWAPFAATPAIYFSCIELVSLACGAIQSPPSVFIFLQDFEIFFLRTTETSTFFCTDISWWSLIRSQITTHLKTWYKVFEVQLLFKNFINCSDHRLTSVYEGYLANVLSHQVKIFQYEWSIISSVVSLDITCNVFKD